MKTIDNIAQKSGKGPVDAVDPSILPYKLLRRSFQAVSILILWRPGTKLNRRMPKTTVSEISTDYLVMYGARAASWPNKFRNELAAQA